MAITAYDELFDLLPAGGLNWPANDCRVVLVDTANYAVDLTNHRFFSSIPAAARVAQGTIGGKVIVSGALDADDTFIPSVTGVSTEALAIYKFVTVDTDSPLLFWEPSAANLPLTPDGSGITITWPAGPNYIARFRRP